MLHKYMIVLYMRYKTDPLLVTISFDKTILYCTFISGGNLIYC